MMLWPRDYFVRRRLLRIAREAGLDVAVRKHRTRTITLGTMRLIDGPDEVIWELLRLWVAHTADPGAAGPTPETTEEFLRYRRLYGTLES